MNKSILVLDTPRSCEDCIFCSAVGSCKFLDDVDESIVNGTKDLRCPLKPVPKRVESASEYASDEMYVKELIKWKKQVDEILEEKEEECYE